MRPAVIEGGQARPPRHRQLAAPQPTTLANIPGRFILRR